MSKIDIKPLSVNECWQGRRFKTPAYKKYCRDVGFLLPNLKLGKPPYKILFMFYFSNPASDWDNPCKPLQDILQKKYNFNDKDIMVAEVWKVIVPKGKEAFSFEITSL